MIDQLVTPTVFLALLVSLAISIALIVTLAVFTIRFGLIILSVEDAIDVSLDELDDVYRTLYQISEKDIFFDSPEVRQAVAAIKKASDSVLYVANEMASIDNRETNKKKEQ